MIVNLVRSTLTAALFAVFAGGALAQAQSPGGADPSSGGAGSRTMGGPGKGTGSMEKGDAASKGGTMARDASACDKLTGAERDRCVRDMSTRTSTRKDTAKDTAKDTRKDAAPARSSASSATSTTTASTSTGASGCEKLSGSERERCMRDTGMRSSAPATSGTRSTK